jgi:hypothetical protein
MKTAGTVTLALCAVLLTGCFTSTPRLDNFAYRLEGTMPGTHFEPQGGIKLGRLSMGLARGIVRAVDDEDTETASHILKGIKRVEVAHYAVSGLPPSTTLPVEVERSFRKNGWRTMARVRDDEQCAWVLYRMDGQHLRSLFVVSVDGEELALVRLEGRLDQVVEAALKMSRDEVKGDERNREEASPAPAPETLVADAEPQVAARR